MDFFIFLSLKWPLIWERNWYFVWRYYICRWAKHMGALHIIYSRGVRYHKAAWLKTWMTTRGWVTQQWSVSFQIRQPWTFCWGGVTVKYLSGFCPKPWKAKRENKQTKRKHPHLFSHTLFHQKCQRKISNGRERPLKTGHFNRV